MLFQKGSSINTRSPKGCVVCGRKTQKGRDFRGIEGYLTTLRACFGIDHDGPGSICNSCQRAICEHKKNGKTFFQVRKWGSSIRLSGNYFNN